MPPILKAPHTFELPSITSMNLLTITLLTATLLLQLQPILAQDPCDSTFNPRIYAAIEAAQLEIKAVFHSSHISSNLRPLSHEIAREWDQWCYRSMVSRKVRLLAHVTLKFAEHWGLGGNPAFSGSRVKSANWAHH
ncbi:hypothetical protein B0H13DRAFT_2368467 [Mycena leptocephala]|nr:hypothetical protein B0H13DRAFT_2368467 [Mycena leptocephala]